MQSYCVIYKDSSYTIEYDENKEVYWSTGTNYVSPSTYSFSFTCSSTDWYPIELVGGGGGPGYWDAKFYSGWDPSLPGWSNWCCAAGGSGAYFNGSVYLEKDKTYTVNIGRAGASSYGNPGYDNSWSGSGGDTGIYINNTAIVVAKGGGGCRNPQYTKAYGIGYGGTVNIVQPNLVKVIINRTGNNGTYPAEGHAYSVYDDSNTGPGASGNCWADLDDHAGITRGAYPGFASLTYTTYKDKKKRKIIRTVLPVIGASNETNKNNILKNNVYVMMKKKEE